MDGVSDFNGWWYLNFKSVLFASSHQTVGRLIKKCYRLNAISADFGLPEYVTSWTVNYSKRAITKAYRNYVILIRMLGSVGDLLHARWILRKLLCLWIESGRQW
jgi:hypothetical protein